MPQKIDVHGVFIDPETITDLYLQKRTAVYYPVFQEVAQSRSLFGRAASTQQHILKFDHHEPYGIILADAEQPEPASYIVKYADAVIERLIRSIGKTGKSITGHFTELLKIDTTGDRQFRILQSGRNIEQTTIREIPAKVHLLNGQWVDVVKSTPGYDFQGGTPYAITDVGAASLMILTKENNYVLYGAGVDVSNDDVESAYRSLTGVYNEIQARRDLASTERAKKPLIQMPQINIQIPKVELPKIDLPQIKFQSPFVLGKKENQPERKELPQPDADMKNED